jgi:hypothetical protein
MQALYLENNLDSTSLTEIRDAFRIHQMQGKAWLLNQVTQFNRNSNILVIGSWLGFTSYCLYKLGFTKITETDPEHRLEGLARTVNRENPNFIHYSKDVNELSLDSYDLIINPSCEHIEDDSWFFRTKIGCNFILHSTNLKWHDHVNTVVSTEDMIEKYPMDLTFAGELMLNPMYSRYMLVGRK